MHPPQRHIYFILLFAHTLAYGQALPLLPAPTGPHQVGVITHYWTDSTHAEPRTLDSLDSRQYAADVFYPALPSPSDTPRTYLPELPRWQAGLATSSTLAPRRVDTLLNVFAQLRTHATERAAADSSTAAYPLLLLSTGGNMSRHWYTALAEELASHGYIVATISHAHSGLDVFPRGGLIHKDTSLNEAVPEDNATLTRYLTEEVRYVFDRLLEGSLPLDTGRIAILGHSRGARPANHLAASDARIKAVVRLDGLGPPVGDTLRIAQPQLTLRGRLGQDRLTELRYLHQTSRGPSYDRQLAGVSHFSFSDLALIAPADYAGPADPLKVHYQIAGAIRTFLGEVFGQ